MDDGHGEWEVTAQAGPHRQDEGTDIKPRDGFDLGQSHKPDGEDNDPPADHGLRAKAIHDPTQQGPQNGRLQRLHRRRTGQRGFAPTALFGQQGHIRTKGLGQQRRLHELQGAGRASDAPSMENFGQKNTFQPCRPGVRRHRLGQRTAPSKGFQGWQRWPPQRQMKASAVSPSPNGRSTAHATAVFDLNANGGNRGRHKNRNEPKKERADKPAHDHKGRGP